MSIQVKQEDGHISLSNGNIAIACDLETGEASVEGKNGFRLSGIRCGVKLSEGTAYDSAGAGRVRCSAAVAEVQDGFGTGRLLSVSVEYESGRTLVRKFYLYEGGGLSGYGGLSESGRADREQRDYGSRGG